VKHRVARIDLVAGDTREATITGYWFSKDRDAVAEKRACKECDDAALERTVGTLLEPLARLVNPPKPCCNVKPEPKPEPRRGIGRLGPAILIGGGIAAVAGGAGFLYFGSKGGSDEPYEYPGATKAGAVLSVVGAVAVVGGALWWRKVKHAERPRFVPPVLVAVGVAALVGGSIALSYGAKRGPDEPFVYNNANELGAPLAIAGGGALIPGAMLWLFGEGER
jgi:hypothetical protein